ncbi:MAG: helix-turn-helix transcriptional regulator [Gemmatimonadaceae bacterium]
MSPLRFRPGSTAGAILRAWRTARKVSQLELALRAGLSARHLSFIETGRAHASRRALLMLAEALDLPLRERNRLLEAAGYAKAFGETPLGATEMSHVREVLRFILDRHEPYGSVVVDRYWNVQMANRPAERSLRAFTDPELWRQPSPNLLRLVFHPLGMRRYIVNWNEVSGVLLFRARRELAGPGNDEQGTELLSELYGYVDSLELEEDLPASSQAAHLVLPMHIRRDGVDIRTFSTIMTLGTPQDVTLQELRVETFFPADETSASILKELAASS